ncbi:nodulation factor fucose acetyltransferase NolL [Bradyrhizobium neotropicale]|uniref:Nodulation protein NolL n=1 Tax=Bradyrhizobium neotropicale TaxID=1497615 RepID=A0A176Z263_9BRAD|nr:nodulation factor fucose acetyltransferase NolL [Bradyrhizobium neotropicale]OAF13147.1 nodulation protein NolL [Bradyrhizobium neotropicale]
MLCHTTLSTGHGSHSAGADNRDLSFDFAKGILIVLVIVGHLLQYVIYRNNDYWYSPYFKSIYMFHMPLFMAISGYLSSRALLRKSLIRSINERAIQLLLPTLFWCAFMETAKVAAFSPSNSITYADILKDFIGSYWFIWAAFASFLVIKVLLTICRRRSMWIIGMSAIAVAILPVTFSILPLIRYTFPFFCLGFLLFQSTEWRARVLPRNKSPLIFSLAALAFACFLVWGKETYAYNNLVLIRDTASAEQVLLMFAGSVAASAIAFEMVLQLWKLSSSNRVARFVAVELGQSTLLLYLLQGTVFRLMDLVQFGELWDLSTRISMAGVLGVVIVVIAMAVRWIVRDLGWVSRVVAGTPPRSGPLKPQSVTN